MNSEHNLHVTLDGNTLIIDNIDSVCARPHHYIDSACARDCFALPNSFAVIAPPALIIDNIDSVCGSKLKDFAVTAIYGAGGKGSILGTVYY